MRIWNLDSNTSNCCDDEDTLTPSSGDAIEVITVEDCNEVEIINFDTGEAFVEILSEGPPGPEGPQGPQGPAGSAGGLVEVVSDTGPIPTGQAFTVVRDSSSELNLTLPAISDVLVDGIATPYSVLNYSDFQVLVFSHGSDQIMFDTSLLVEPGNSFDLLPTTLGWLIK